MRSATLPSISVAMGTYNGARFIRSQIDSLLAQTHPPREIIVSDDNSTDATLEIVREIASQVTIPIVVSVNSTRLGYRSNFMQAASLCTSDLISFCDQDDVWHPRKLEAVAQPFLETDVLMAFHNAEVVDEGGQSLGRFLHDPQERSHLKGRLGTSPWNQVLGFTQTFRTSLLQFSSLRLMTEDPYAASEHLAHDQWIRILAAGFGRTAYVGEVLADYRQHQNNVYGRPADGKSRARVLAEKFLRNSDYDRLARVVLKIAKVFQSAQTGLPADLVAKAADAESRYLALSNYYASRARIYHHNNFGTRAREWHHLLKTGAYLREQPIQFGEKSYVRDLLAGVLLGSFKNTGLRSAFYTDYDSSLTFHHID